MFFKQFYLGCLSHASYLLGSQGEGVIIDPQRDVDEYLETAQEQGLTIRYIVETHLHADFVSGHRELAERTGARIVMGHRAGAVFPHLAVREGDTLDVGKLRLRILETPGHTPEAISILAEDTEHPEAPAKLFTGDTLFVGDVGRPDLSGSRGFTAEQMAAQLFDTLHEKILPLDDSVEVYPAHGAGSLCGRNMSKETWSTLGVQRRENYALKPMSKEAFVAMMTTGLPEAPKYFALDVQLNREGAPALKRAAGITEMTPAEVAAQSASGMLVLDVRPSEIYGPEHVPGSLNIGLDGQFASWAGTLIDFDRPVILVAQDEEEVVQAVMRLARVGFTQVKSVLQGGINAWKDAGYKTACVPQVPIDEFARVALTHGDAQILDVRRPAEFATGAAPGAISAPLGELDRHLGVVDPGRKTYVVCGSGYRSSIATSLLEARGFANLLNVDGGMGAYAAAGYETVVPATA